jgi:hypothetical protein
VEGLNQVFHQNRTSFQYDKLYRATGWSFRRLVLELAKFKSAMPALRQII